MSIGPVLHARPAPSVEPKVTSSHRSAAAAARVRRRQLYERLFRGSGAAAISVGLVEDSASSRKPASSPSADEMPPLLPVLGCQSDSASTISINLSRAPPPFSNQSVMSPPSGHSGHTVARSRMRM